MEQRVRYTKTGQDKTFSIMQNARSILRTLGYPSGDNFNCPNSPYHFPAGGNYGIEVSSVNNLDILEKVINHAEKLNLNIDRVDECRGIFRLPDTEITEMVNLCKEKNIGLVMSTGPRAIYDIGAFSGSLNGSRSGYRIRGMENVVYAINDVLRAISLGVRGILVYDEGLLDILNKMRDSKVLPFNTVLKLSVHAGYSNPASIKLMEGLGANTINPIPDLDLCMLSTLRDSVKCPLDIFTDTAKDAGGLIRTHEVPEMIRVASPVYLKCGAVSQSHQNHLPSHDELLERMKQIRCVVDTIERELPSAIPVNKKESSLAIPGGIETDKNLC